MRDPAKRYHIMTKAELQALSPDYNWDAYLKGDPAAKAWFTGQLPKELGSVGKFEQK